MRGRGNNNSKKKLENDHIPPLVMMISLNYEIPFWDTCRGTSVVEREIIEGKNGVVDKMRGAIIFFPVCIFLRYSAAEMPSYVPN